MPKEVGQYPLELDDGFFFNLFRKTYHDDPLSNSTKGGGCIGEAEILKIANGGIGEVRYVFSIQGKRIGHAYYIPNPKDLNSKALNQADNGYEGYPQLTVAQVLQYGIIPPTTADEWQKASMGAAYKDIYEK